MVVSTKYLKAASSGRTPRVSATRVMLASESVSMPIVVLSRSGPVANTTPPAAPNRSSTAISGRWVGTSSSTDASSSIATTPAISTESKAATVPPGAPMAGSIATSIVTVPTVASAAVLRVSAEVNTRTMSAPTDRMMTEPRAAGTRKFISAASPWSDAGRTTGQGQQKDRGDTEHRYQHVSPQVPALDVGERPRQAVAAVRERLDPANRRFEGGGA